MAATGAILAGGVSRRMGRDKLSLRVGGPTLVRRVYDALHPVCAEVLFVGNESPPIPQGRRVVDARPGRLGPLAGIEAALLAARHRSVFVAAGDMPFLSGSLVRGLLALLGQRGALVVAPCHDGKVHPLCAAFDRDGTLPAVSAALDREELAVHDMLENLPDVFYPDEQVLRAYGEPGRLLMNVNSPEDLERARAFLGRHEQRGS